MVKRLDRMLDLLDVAFKAMVDNLESSALFLKDISNAEDAEYNINEYRNSLREEHIVNIEKRRLQLPDRSVLHRHSAGA